MTETEYLEIDKRTNRTIKFFRVRKNSPTVEFVAEGAKLHFGNRDIDTLTCTVPVGFLKKDDQVVVSYKTVDVFRGTVESRVAHRSRGLTASETVTVSGPWSKMSRLVYRQNWFTGAGYEFSSRLILNQHQSGTRQNLASELREILTHGKGSCGYAVGEISVPNQFLPFDECRDITIADAVKRELRFFPMAIVRFDYSKTTPEIIVTRANAGADAAYVADIPKTMREYSYTEHPITGVDLEIETTGEIEGVKYRNITHQKAGDTAAGNPDCLYATLHLAGASWSNTRQTFDSKTEDIPEDLNSIEWWQEKHPRIATIDPAHLSITDGKRSGAADAAKYPRISGNSAGEIEAAGLRCRAEKFTCKVTIDSGYETEENLELTMFFLTTNATTRKYSWVSDSSATTAETVPVGLASAILADRSGELLQERMTIRLGDSFPVLGDSCDGLFLQAFDVDCEDLTAELTFGQPDHLSPEDMASLLSGFRNKCTSTSSGSRSTGKKEDDAKDEEEVGGIPPLSSSEFCPGTKKKTTIAAEDGTTGSIELDSSKLEEGEKVEVKELTIKAPGSAAATRAADATEAKVKILAGKNVTLQEKQIVEGKGIKVTEIAPGTVQISLSGEDEGSGDAEGPYTGELILGGPISYANHQITQQVYTLNVKDGLIVGASETSNPPIVAVEETV